MTYLSLNDEADGASYTKVTDGALTPAFRRRLTDVLLHGGGAALIAEALGAASSTWRRSRSSTPRPSPRSTP